MTASPDVLTLSFSLSLIVKTEKRKSTVEKASHTFCMSARQQQSRRVKRRPAHAISIHKDLKFKPVQPATPLPTSSVHTDTRFTSLSDRAQQMQRRVREQLGSQKQRRTVADLESARGPATDRASQAAVHTETSLRMDRESLRLLEATSNRQTAPGSETRMTTSGCMNHEPNMETSRRMDRESLRLLQTAHDEKAKEPRDEDLLQMSNGWSIIDLTISAALNMVYDLLGTPSSRDSELQRDTSTALSTPQLYTTKLAQPPRLSRSSFDISPLQLDESATAHRPHSTLVKSVDSVGTPSDVPQHQQSLVGESTQASEQTKIQHDYIYDPFGVRLAYGGKGEDDRLRHSLVKYRREQAESVHELFRQLEQKDREESCQETSRNLTGRVVSGAKDVEGLLMESSSGAQPQAHLRDLCLASEVCEAAPGEEKDGSSVAISSKAMKVRERGWHVI